MFHCGSLSLVDEPIRTALRAAVETVRRAGALISFDVNYCPSLWPKADQPLEAIWGMVREANVVKVNEGKLKMLTRSNSPDVGGHSLPKRGPEFIAVTLGPLGSYYCAAQAHGHVPAFRIPVVVAVGCSDAFEVGLISCLAQRPDWREYLTEEHLALAFRYANAVGAITALAPGVIPALLSAARVEEFLERRA